jgi:hypothetical protein
MIARSPTAPFSWFQGAVGGMTTDTYFPSGIGVGGVERQRWGDASTKRAPMQGKPLLDVRTQEVPFESGVVTDRNDSRPLISFGSSPPTVADSE